MSNGPNDRPDGAAADVVDGAATDVPDHKHPIADSITGLGQKIIGEIESIGGILTGDPVTAAEGGFNVDVGEVREEAEEGLEESGSDD